MEFDRTKKKKTHSTEELGKPNLPHDLIVDLLSWLPAKSLLRFRLVCKSWQDLIKNPSFVKMHLQHASSTSNENFSLIVYNDVNRENDCLYAVDFDGESSGKVVTLDYPFYLGAYNFVTIVGSCNGLLCVRVTSESNDPITYVWNPCTSEYKDLPFTDDIDTIYDHEPDIYHEPESPIYGFGYDNTIDDYKVVCVESYNEKDDGYDSYAVQVCTLGSNSWRRIGDFPYTVKPSPAGVFVNGAIHWLVYSGIIVNRMCRMLIVSLNLGDEKYHEVQLPDCFSNNDDCFDGGDHMDMHVRVNLGVLGGSLCVLHDDSDTHINVWMMTDYGERSSWTKFLTIAEPCVESSICSLKKGMTGYFSRQTDSVSGSSKVFPYLDDLKLIKRVKNGDILVNDGCRSFLLYGPHYERARNLKIEGFVEVYVGSLVSFNTGSYGV